jgi:glycosyltransferase involved in cell wall biosynthesis
MKVAIVYDHLTKIGGAERILVALHELFPDAPLYTAVYNRKRALWFNQLTVISSFMQYLPFAQVKHEYYPGIPLFAFEQFDFSSFDVVISVTSKEAKGIITGPHTLHICYCLTPTRYLWSHYQDYFRHALTKYLSLPVVSLLRVWDQIAATRPDTYLAISSAVGSRIRKYYHRPYQVIYPPVKIDRFVPAISQTGDFFLVVARLVAYKHIEIAIHACNQLQVPLKIIGTGMESDYLKSLAGPTVEFVGSLTETALIRYYQTCRALLFPQDEDFGITAVEALAVGKPVIAYKSGGALEIVKEGITGEFFWPQNAEALVDILRKFDPSVYNTMACRKQAEKFSDLRFKEIFFGFIKEEWNRFRKEHFGNREADSYTI